MPPKRLAPSSLEVPVSPREPPSQTGTGSCQPPETDLGSRFLFSDEPSNCFLRLLSTGTGDIYWHTIKLQELEVLKPQIKT